MHSKCLSTKADITFMFSLLYLDRSLQKGWLGL